MLSLLVAVVVTGIAGNVYPDALLVQNGGPVLDVTRPPAGVRAARGDGKVDDTEALRDVFDWLKAKYQKGNGFDNEYHFYVYLPNGTYRVSDTLIYRGKTIGAFPDWNGTFDINHLHFVGQSEQGTKIQLDNGAPGFGDPGKPKAVLALQHPDTVFNNVPGSNWVRDLTIDVGAKNPGAAGLYLQGANNADLKRVRIVAPNGSGRFGIWSRIGSLQGYYSDVTIQGFDVGYRQTTNAEIAPAFERLTLIRQREAGILATGGSLSLRRLTSTQPSGVPAIRQAGPGSQIVLIDSVLRGSGGAAIEVDAVDERGLYARDVVTSGYQNALVRGTDRIPGGTLAEWVSHPKTSLFGSPSANTKVISPEDTPATPQYAPDRWAIVDDYPSIQAAFDSGRPVVVFKKRRYRLQGDVRVPATAKVVMGMAAASEGGSFVVTGASDQPIWFEDTTTPIRIEATRNAVQRCATGGISNPRNLPVTLFLENVNDVATGNDFCPSKTRVFARQIDIEYGNAEQIVVNGGRMWIFGYKTENGTSAPYTVRKGGSLEILGGYSNAVPTLPPDRMRPILTLEDGAGPVAVTLFSNLNGVGEGGAWNLIVRETRGGQRKELRRESLPRRGGVYRDDFSLVRFVGGS